MKFKIYIDITLFFCITSCKITSCSGTSCLHCYLILPWYNVLLAQSIAILWQISLKQYCKFIDILRTCLKTQLEFICWKTVLWQLKLFYLPICKMEFWVQTQTFSVGIPFFILQFWLLSMSNSRSKRSNLFCLHWC